MKVLLIIPAYNEEKNLQSLLPELMNCVSSFDILIVDDGSTDNTSAIARKYQIPVIRLNRDGIGNAMHTGFLYALKNNYEIAVQIDGDGQHNPSLVKELIQPIIDEKADFVIGSRYTKNRPDPSYKAPFLRRIGMYYSSAMLYFFSGVYIADTTSGFRALNRNVLIFFETNYPSKYPEAGVLFKLMLTGFKIVELPVTMRTRKFGQSMYNPVRIFFYPLNILLGFIKIYLGAKFNKQ